ncbi:MAG: AAA family ATPase [Candidatus Eisenbacteria bacterium]|uniref:non-specific serine/threonine protein kinase n=1 Tax=Eiseniibacteriota bacterium TaxID=2212470 RepID=A0A849SDU9_UNCEI|nr:AAA family ATPase [Candidatus Eisenbacteria bacterium]
MSEFDPTTPINALPSRQAGDIIAGRYRLTAWLGRGGMGEVWRAHDPQLARDVAVKVVSPAAFDTAGRARLLREARIAASLNHPHIVAVHDAGEDGVQPYLVMELVLGENLRERPPRTTEGAVVVAKQVLDALAHAHAHGVVHRDLKPENLLATGPVETPRIKLSDLGVARASASGSETAQGTILGTANYLSPEQALGGEIDGRADLYALGVLLYELIAGRLPFTGSDALAVISQHLHSPPSPPRAFRPDLSPALERFVLRLLAKAPEQRFATAAEAAKELERICTLPAVEANAEPATTLLDQLVRGRMVGRASEFERLREVWRSALAGRAQLALVSGEPGVGKTRFARELIVAARVDGAAVLMGGCYEFEATTPYLPFVEALSAWARGRSAESMRSGLGDAAEELARLVPEINARLGPYPPISSLAPHEERLRLFDAFARFLRALAAARGLVVMLDDVQWADTGTLGLLRYLLRQLGDSRVLMLAAYREVELDRAHPLAAALVEWNRERIATRIALGRLGRADTDALLATLMGQESVTADFGEVIHRETEGNPFFIEEVVKSLIDQGEIYREGGEWQRRAVHELAIPQSVKAAIGRRLDKLSRECIETLHVAAVLGKTFAFADLAASSERSEDALLDALDEAATAQLMVARENETFAFTHDKIREVLYEEQNPVRRRRSHQRIGEAIEAREPSRVEDLAFHFMHSGDLERAYQWTTAAAERAQHVFALDEAAQYGERARECAEALNDPARLLVALRALAMAHSLRGDTPTTLRTCEEALKLCTTATERGRINAIAGEACVRVGRAEGEAYLAAANRELDPATQPFELAIVKGNIARIHHYRMEHRRAIALLHEALATPGIENAPWVKFAIVPFLAGSHQHLCEFEESMRWAQLCVDAGREARLPGFEASGHEFMAEDLNSIGRFREGLEHAHADLRIGERTGSLDREAWGGWCVMWSLSQLGDLVEAIGYGERAYQLAAEIGESRLTCILSLNHAWMLWERNREPEAEALLRDGAERARQLGHGLTLAVVALARAQLELRKGNGEAAYAAAIESIEVRRGTENLVSMDQCQATASMAATLCGRFDMAEQHANVALELSNRLGLIFGLGLSHLAFGLLAATRAQFDQAISAYDQALAAFEPHGIRIEAARVRGARSRALEAAGRSAEAAAERERAMALFDACGVTREAAELRAGAGEH